MTQVAGAALGIATGVSATMPTDTQAIVLSAPRHLSVNRIAIDDPSAQDVVVEVEWSGISAGTERMLWAGTMPAFPGMGYPLVPGYESVGRIVAAGDDTGRSAGESVFVPGAQCFGPIRGLFGGAARRLVVAARRALPIDPDLAEDGALLALAATAHHAIAGHPVPDLVVGHGVLGRLVARLVVALGHPAPVVHETDASRRAGATGYDVVAPLDDPRRDYRVICDVSGAASILDQLVQRAAPGGEIILAGFYAEPLSFAFPPAFMREIRLRVAAQWQPADLTAVEALVATRRLALDGLVTHRAPADAAPEAYRTAFEDPSCLKMLIDWRGCT